MTEYTNLYVVYDSVAEERGPIFEAKNDNVAIRQYYNLLSQTTNPDDFILIYIGKCGKSGQFELISDYEVVETQRLIKEVVDDEKAI